MYYRGLVRSMYQTNNTFENKILRVVTIAVVFDNGLYARFRRPFSDAGVISPQLVCQKKNLGT